MKRSRSLLIFLSLLSWILLCIASVAGAPAPAGLAPVLVQSISPTTVPEFVEATNVAAFNEWVYVGSYKNGKYLCFERDLSTGQMQFKTSTAMHRTVSAGGGSLNVRSLPDGNGVLYGQVLTDQDGSEASIHYFHIDANTGGLALIGSYQTASLPMNGWPFTSDPGPYGYAGFCWNPDYSHLYRAYLDWGWINFAADGSPDIGGTADMEHVADASGRPWLTSIFSPDGKQLYVLETPSGGLWQVDQYNVDAAGTPTYAATLMLPDDISALGWGGTFFDFTPDGQFVYAACPLAAGGGYLVAFKRNVTTGALSVAWKTNDAKVSGLINLSWQPVTLRINADGEGGYFTSVGWAGSATLYPFGLNDATGALTIYDGIAGYGGYFNLDSKNGFLYWGSNPLNVYKTPGGGKPLPFDLNCTDPINLTADSGAANPQTAVTLLHTIDTAVVPALTATTDTSWLSATVSGSGASQTITVTANIAGFTSGIYHAQVKVSAAGYTLKRKRNVVLRINGTPSPVKLTVSPLGDTLSPGGSVTFSAAMIDQFGAAFTGSVDWTVSGGGTITPAGVFTSDGTQGAFKVRATAHVKPALWTEALVRVEISMPLVNPGFESPSVSGYQYNPTDAGWTFEGQSGIESNGSAFGASSAPQGTQAAILQNDLAVISQSVHFEAGRYQVNFQAAARLSYGGLQTIELYFDNTKIGTFSPTLAAFTVYHSDAFDAAVGDHTIAFKGAASGDNTAFIDDVSIKTAVSSVQNSPAKLTPSNVALDGVFPNPFFGTAQVKYSIPSSQKVSVRVYDVSGRLVRTLVNGAMSAGYHTVSFNGLDDRSRELRNGVYFCRMQAKGFETVQKMMIVR